MRKYLSLCVLTAALGSLVLADVASALPVPVAAPLPVREDSTAPSLLIQVQEGTLRAGSTRSSERRQNRRIDRHYDRRVHGPRCSYRRGDCRYYRGGYYYRSPWWLLPLALPGAMIDSTVRRSSGSSHVRWCLAQYRSYNPRTNLWLSYSGQYRRCNSPFD